jgi:hypothetical protein
MLCLFTDKKFSIDNMIDEESFLLLNEGSLKEMEIPVGPRLKLQKKLQELRVSDLYEWTIPPLDKVLK